jgi:hypothetical protein
LAWNKHKDERAYGLVDLKKLLATSGELTMDELLGGAKFATESKEGTYGFGVISNFPMNPEKKK